MSLMSIFCGSLYNEFFSLPMNLFGSCYKKEWNTGTNAWEGVKIENCVYPWGFDPIWF